MCKMPKSEGLTDFAVGDKVRVVANTDPRFKSYVGKRGVVAGAITRFSCRVKLVGDLEYYFDKRELEKI
jgi:ribosomal protein L21E